MPRTKITAESGTLPRGALRRGGASAVMVWALLACSTTAAGGAGANPACGEGAGDCFLPNGTPGCAVADCCNIVCQDGDPFCCDFEWNDLCVVLAMELCDAASLCPGQGECYAANGSPGCGDDDCCTAVCGTEPSCCQGPWTQECADLALAECPCGAPNAGDCFEANDTAGCADATCCDVICGIDGYCCFAGWDQICSVEATQFCPAQPCEVQCPQNARLEPELCGELLNEGCNSQITNDPEPPPPFTPIACGDTICGSVFASGTRDTDWYEITVTEPTQLSWTVISEFPASVLITEGDCDLRFGALAEDFGTECTATSAVGCVAPGTYYLFISSATAERTLRAGAPCPACPADFNDDGFVDAFDLAALLGAWGENPGHGADLNEDEVVDAFDLAQLLGGWGPCSLQPQPEGALWGNDYLATVTCTACGA